MGSRVVGCSFQTLTQEGGFKKVDIMGILKKVSSFVLLQRELRTLKIAFDSTGQYYEVMAMLMTDLDLCCMLLPEFSRRPRTDPVLFFQADGFCKVNFAT